MSQSATAGPREQLICSGSCMQNDLQAMARCHRIGQDKDVTVYRLITDATYEQDVFACSTRKQGTLSWPCQGGASLRPVTPMPL